MQRRLIPSIALLLCSTLAGAQHHDGAIRAYLLEQADELGLTAADAQHWRISDQPSSKSPGVSIVHVNQMVNSLDVHNAIITCALRDGRVVHLAGRFVRDAATLAGPSEPALSAPLALRAAADAMDLDLDREPVVLHALPGGILELSPSGIAHDPIRARLIYQPVDDGRLRLAWELTIRSRKSASWWNIAVDAGTGDLLRVTDYTVQCQFPEAGHHHHAHAKEACEVEAPRSMPGTSGYRVFDAPVESPNHGTRTLVIDPADPIASPYGWHDVNGVAGSEFTTTRGNNVRAYEDADDDDQPGYSPEGGATLTFDFPLNLGLAPDGNQDASITNLFYWNNLMHDVWQRYGFDEQSGNFQQTNYSGAGSGGDHVLAEAQDGGGTNNANFSSPPEGSNGRMQMYNWTAGSPDRDGSFDNGVVAHEYGHGISIRLTGGGSNSSCLSNDEQMGEGWSDWFGLMLTMEPGDQGTDGRGMATYASGEAITGVGIRPARYSTSFAVNDYTYGATNNSSLSEPHGVGFVWATMLWDLTWALVDAYGFDPDLYTGSGGNNIAMQLVIEALKLQPCSPGFVDGRDAILAADELLYAGANRCLIWQVFATRGLGFSADQGSSTSRFDQTEAFDLPNSCLIATEPPSAAFTFSILSACNGTVSFTDASTDIPQGWSWDFGDGSTSTEEDPSHTYATSGTYTVTLTVTNNIGSDTQSMQVTIDLPEPPTADDITVCHGTPGTLTANAEDEAVWYDAQNEPLGSGNPFITAPLTSTSTFFVRNEIASAPVNVGPVNNAIGTGGQHGNAFIGTVNFTAFQPLTLVSAWVEAATAGVRTISLWNGVNGTSGAPIQTIQVNVPVGQGRIDLGFHVPAPGVYSVGGNNMNLYRNNAGAVYPYTQPGLISLTGSSSTTGNGFYYYLYDLEVVADPCRSAPVEVTAYVVPGANFTYAANGSTLTFSEASGGASSWLWDFGDGSTSTEQNPVHTYASAGPFTITLTVDGGACSSTQVWELGVGVEEAGSGSAFEIVPNPAADVLSLTFGEGAQGAATVDLIDAAGRRVLTKALSRGAQRVQLDVSALAPGTYQVLLRTEQFAARRSVVVAR